MNTLFVGIDVSTKNNQVCAVNFNQDIFFNLSFPNNPDGCNLLITTVLSFVDKEKFDSMNQLLYMIIMSVLYHLSLALLLSYIQLTPNPLPIIRSLILKWKRLILVMLF